MRYISALFQMTCIGRSMAHEYENKSLMEFTEAYDMISN